MKNLFRKMVESIITAIGLKMVAVGESSLNTCLAFLGYEPNIPNELLNEMDSN